MIYVFPTLFSCLYADEPTGQCVKQADCSCMHDGKAHSSGDVMNPDSCNSCTCSAGSWTCTDNVCPAECKAVGDPHYTTFDGTLYTFQVRYSLSYKFTLMLGTNVWCRVSLGGGH